MKKLDKGCQSALVVASIDINRLFTAVGGITAFV
jgi:hypothetical protein